jgi:hypothetical protein
LSRQKGKRGKFGNPEWKNLLSGILPSWGSRVKVGSVEVAVWENRDEKKGVWHSVTLQRSYKSNEEWENANNFRLTDLKDVAAAVEEVNRKMRVRITGDFSKRDAEQEET